MTILQRPNKITSLQLSTTRTSS